MLILILVLVFLYFFIKFNKIESFINFRLPNDGHWCKNNDCKYPVITIIDPTLENKDFVKQLNPNNNILPKNKSMNAACVNCILQNNNKCMYITIDSKESILKISELFVKWFNLMDIEEKEDLIKKKIFYFKDNNLYFNQVDKKKPENNKEYLIKPAVITNDKNTVYADEINIIDDKINISIEFYVLLLVIFYKLSISKETDQEILYNNSNKKFIKNYINQICKNFSFNQIKDNQYIFDKKDDYYEKCNINILSNNLSEKIIHDYNKNMVENTSKMIKESLSSATMKINSTLRKNEYLSKIKDTNDRDRIIKDDRQHIYKNDNVFNEKCLADSNYLKHSENRYSEIEDTPYLYSCGNFFADTEENRKKFEKCDKFGILNNLIPSSCCLIGKQETNINTVDKRFNIYQEAEGCNVVNNKDTIICEQKDFIFNYNNMELKDKKRC
jgi:hypothetical protein